MGRILVLNATGKVSTAIVDALAAAGHAVTAASRHPSIPSTDAVRRVHLDYGDPSSFGAALDGVDRVFWLGPPMVVDAEAHTRAFFDAALPQVDKVVLMTAAGVEYDDRIPLRQVELRVERSGTAWTVIRPSWFLDNFHTFWIHGILAEGQIALPAADARSAFVDARDIAASAVAALTDRSTDGQAYTITGPEALTYTEAAARLGAAIDRPIQYVPIDDDTFVAAMIGAGLPPDYAHFLDALFQAVRQGGAATVTGDVERLTGQAPRSIEDYAATWAGAFQG